MNFSKLRHRIIFLRPTDMIKNSMGETLPRYKPFKPYLPLPVQVDADKVYSSNDNDGNAMLKYPAMETKEELIVNAEKLKNIFLYTPLKVQDRYLSVNEVTFDTDKSALITYFELEFIQETNTKSASQPKMKNLDERVVTDSHGTSENIN